MIQPIKAVAAYQTADGEVFATPEQAMAWHARLNFQHYCDHGNHFHDADENVIPPMLLADWLADNRAAVLEFLQTCEA